mgnify:CR=1 FL=1
MLIENGNYTLATEKVKEALAAFRDAYRAMCRIAGKFMAAVETQRKAEGLIVAMNRTFERLERLRGTSPFSSSRRGSCWTMKRLRRFWRLETSARRHTGLQRRTIS